MKIKTALLVGLLILNGSAYAMVANHFSIPKLEISRDFHEIAPLPKASVPSMALEKVSGRNLEMNSRLNDLISEYETSRRLSSSS